MRLRRVLGLDKPNADVARAKITVMSRHVPLLYFVICVNTVLLSYLHFGRASIALTLVVPAVIVAACSLRAIVRARRTGQHLPDAVAIRRLTMLAVIGGGVSAFIFAWTLRLASYGDAHTHNYAIMFLAVTVICCIFCLMQLRLAVILLALIVVVPLSGMLLLDPQPTTIAMGVNFFLVCAAILYVTTMASFDFENMIEAQIATQKLSDENARLADLDSLTGLPNRRLLQRHIGERRRNGELVAMGILDLDGFKAINDNYGHKVGDLLIQQWAREMPLIAGEHCFVARLGGDEFALVKTGPDAGQRIQAAALRILERMQSPFRIGERTLVVGATIGLAIEGEIGTEAGELMRQADVAMYAAKCAGKMRFKWFDEDLDRDRAFSHRIETELREAIDKDRFSVVYQPIFDARDGTVRAVEALLRWDRPGAAEIGPAVFVPIAEETGLIDRLGLWVLRRACQDALAWRNVKLAVNMSAAQLRNPDLCHHVAQTLAESGFPADRLELEITETYLLRDPQIAQRVLGQLRELGVGIVLDDFGTGYASIGFLRQLPFDKLKIDQSLVQDIGKNPAARAIVQASVAVARSLDMAVVAEGIEVEDQAMLMRLVGCDMLQGWLFARPCNALEVSVLLLEDPNADLLRDSRSEGEDLPAALG